MAGAKLVPRPFLLRPPLPVLLRMASPNAVAFVVQASVSMTEVWYVGQLGTVSLAAMALVFPGLMLMQMLANGAMGGAVTSAVAQTIGRGQREDAERLIWHALAHRCARRNRIHAALCYSSAPGCSTVLAPAPP